MPHDDTTSGGSRSKHSVDSAVVIDVVNCGETDIVRVTEAAKSLDAKVRVHESYGDWLEKHNKAEELPWSDVTALVGVGKSLAEEGFVEKAVERLATAHLIVAVQDSSVINAAELFRQGAKGLLCLQSGRDRLHTDLEWYLRAAVKSRPSRRAVFTHRRNLANLTQAEIDVLDLMLDGNSNKQIAEHLEISLRTVELRRSKLMKKMEARNLAQLVFAVCRARPERVLI